MTRTQLLFPCQKQIYCHSFLEKPLIIISVKYKMLKKKGFSLNYLCVYSFQMLIEKLCRCVCRQIRPRKMCKRHLLFVSLISDQTRFCFYLEEKQVDTPIEGFT